MLKIIYLMFLIINNVLCHNVFESENIFGINSTNVLGQNFFSSFEIIEETIGNQGKISFVRNINFYLPKLSPNLSEECYKDLATLFSVIRRPSSLVQNKWILPLMDSWGKSVDGVLQGNRLLLGFFDECLNVKINGSSPDNGRYCLVTYRSEQSSEPGKVSVESKILPLLGIPVNSYYGTCIPSSCSREEFVDSVSEEMSLYGFELKSVECQSKVDESKFDSAEIFGIVFFSLLALVVILSSILDIYIEYFKKEHLKKNKGMMILLAFSFPKNMSKIFNINLKKDPNIFSCIHGLRVISLSWVILGHQYYYSSYVASNLSGAVEITQGFFMQIISNGDKVVDTFFTISGLLVSYSFFRHCFTKKKFPYFQYYLFRVIRLAPPVLMMVIFLATLGGLIPYGPFAPQYKDVKTEACQAFWWVDWTFFSNFVYRFGDKLVANQGESFACIAQCWYLAVDTQIYLIMPLILVPFLYSKKYGFYILSAVTIASFAIPAIIIGVNDTYPSSMITINTTKDLAYSQKVYMMPYCRASPYLIGVWAGYLLWKNNHEKIKLSPKQVALGWIASAVFGFIIVYGLYPFNYVDRTNPADDISLWYSVLYGGFHRGIWGMCISWVIIACHWGYGGMVDSFLSHPGQQPLSRLTFCMYIVALPIQDFIIYSTIQPTYYNSVTKITEACGALFYSGIGALLLSLVSEAPVLNIQSMFK